jgi:tetratricopeptide (TPR) repeat protein
VRRRARGALLLLLALTAAAYAPVRRAEFTRFDDNAYVTENPQLRDRAGLRAIWDPRATGKGLQFYPLVFTSYWVEHRLWGLWAPGYHATNLALHLANVGLVAALTRALGLTPLAAVAAAAVFALHPAQVESVAWVAERKNVLSGCFYLLAFLAYLRFRRGGGRRAYATCLVSFVAALLSKTQTAVLPVVLLVGEWTLERPSRVGRDAFSRVGVRVLPMVLLGVLAAVLTAAVEAATIRPPVLTAGQRILVAANAAWFYVGTLLAPIKTCPMYPLWNLTTAAPVWWIAAAAWVIVAAAWLRWWRVLPSLALLGLAQFFVALAPVLGFVSFNYLRYAYVADRFLYLPLVGVGILAGVAADAVARKAPAQRRAAAIAAVALVAGWGVLTSRGALHWQSNESLLLRSVACNPDGFIPNFNLALHYRRGGQWERALPRFERATQIYTKNDRAFRGYAEALRRVHGAPAAVAACTAKLATAPQFYAAHLERAISLEQMGRLADARRDYERTVALTRPHSPTWREATRALARLTRAP